MIRQIDSLFILDTKKTSYVFQVLPTGHLEHLYYGASVDEEGIAALTTEKVYYPIGNATAYDAENPALCLEDRCLEISTLGKGDCGEMLVELVTETGITTSDFLYESAKIQKKKEPLKQLPYAYDESNQTMELVVTLKEANAPIYLDLCYSVMEECDVIIKSVRLRNKAKERIVVNRLLSNQLMFDTCDFDWIHFNGAWAREMNLLRQPVAQGRMVNESLTGTSSNRANPFVMLAKHETGEDFGACYGFNLIYSGNHYEAVQVNAYGKLRLVQGIHPATFSWNLMPGEMLESPEAVLTFSENGFTQLSHNMHTFVNEHIVRGSWKKKERPVLLNSWEAAYFDINEKKLLSMAKEAAKVGIELFVVDDGWFGKRDNDQSSLGDWYVNKKKLPNGLEGLSKKINDLGLDFGIWVEPEMVNVDSDCYRNHPEWCMAIPGQGHSEGRNQRILDLTNPEVIDYVIASMKNVFSMGNISYVKWDMNRNFSDYYSPYLETLRQKDGINRQQEVSHRYVLGLYQVMDTLVKAFPDILFEGCSSGGNRFDLGILSYFPQIWASDDTDAWERMNIQTGYSYGYPMSTITAHVSGCPNHQTLRNTPLETRFQVAAFGVLGYECNIKEMSKEECLRVKAQIEFYKEHRQLLQFGEYYRIKNGSVSNLEYLNRGDYQWIVVGPDKKKAMAFYGQPQCVPNYVYGKLITKGLDEQKRYRMTNRTLTYDIREFGSLVNAVSPVNIKQGSLLHNTIAHFVKMKGETEDVIATGRNFNHAGIKLQPKYAGTGYDERVADFQDYGSRVYLFEEIGASESEVM